MVCTNNIIPIRVNYQTCLFYFLPEVCVLGKCSSRGVTKISKEMYFSQMFPIENIVLKTMTTVGGSKDVIMEDVES